MNLQNAHPTGPHNCPGRRQWVRSGTLQTQPWALVQLKIPQLKGMHSSNYEPHNEEPTHSKILIVNYEPQRGS